MSGIYNNPGAVVALQALQTANAALAKTTNELSTGKTVATVADDPAAYVIASGLRSDASALGAVSDCLCGAEVPTKVAGAAINSVSNILIDLKEAVINAQSGGGAATAEGVQIQSLLSQISSNVTDASVNGVNLISGALGGSVQATQIKVPADIYGQMMTIGDTSLSTRSAMNASVAGLGLNGAPSNLDGLNIQCPGLAAGNIATGAPATQLVLQTTNYGDPSSETSQFPGQSWTFQFTDAANPAPAAETPSSHDTYGNVLQQDNIIPVALKAGFTLDDAMHALQQALGGAGFETNLSQQALPGQPLTAVSLNIAGNNIDQNAISSVQNLRPTWPDPVEEYQARTNLATLSGKTRLQLSALPLPAQAAFTSYAGAQYLGTASDLSNYMLNPATAAFFTSSSLSPGTPDPNVGIQNGTTIAPPPTTTATNPMILSEPVTKDIALGQFVWLLMPLVPAVDRARCQHCYNQFCDE